MLVYPGRQIDGFAAHSVGMDGVIASIRLKNLRRGIQDAGYLQLARARDAAMVVLPTPPLPMHMTRP